MNYFKFVCSILVFVFAGSAFAGDVNYIHPSDATVLYVTKGTQSRADHGGGKLTRIQNNKVVGYRATGEFVLPNEYKPANLTSAAGATTDIRRLVTPALASWNNDGSPVHNHVDFGMVVRSAKWVPAAHKIVVEYEFTKLPDGFAADIGELYILAGVWIVLDPVGPHPDFPRP